MWHNGASDSHEVFCGQPARSGFGRIRQRQQARKPAWCTLCIMCAAVVGGGVVLQFQECTKVLAVAVEGVLLLRV